MTATPKPWEVYIRKECGHEKCDWDCAPHCTRTGEHSSLADCPGFIYQPCPEADAVVEAAKERDAASVEALKAHTSHQTGEDKLRRKRRARDREVAAEKNLRTALQRLQEKP